MPSPEAWLDPGRVPAFLGALWATRAWAGQDRAAGPPLLVPKPAQGRGCARAPCCSSRGTDRDKCSQFPDPSSLSWSEHQDLVCVSRGVLSPFQDAVRWGSTDVGPVIPCQIPRDFPAQEPPGLSSATPVSPHPEEWPQQHGLPGAQSIPRPAGGVTPPSRVPFYLGQSLVPPPPPLLGWGQGHAGAPEQEPKDTELNSSSSLSP